MTRPRIALLDASHGAEHTPRNFRRELDADLVEFDATAGETPPPAAGADVDAAVVTGSRASVYWDRVWIDPVREWVADADGTLPLLGVCWGHQLIADALGGRGEDVGTYEIGYRTVERTAASIADPRLLRDVPERFTVFMTHSDRVAELPPGADPIARNEYGNHGFRRGDTFGVQFHPEYDAAAARTVTLEKDDALDGATLDRVLRGIDDEATVAAAQRPKALFDNFVRLVRTRRPVEA
jgi:GMP synthase (glutamine-hydrolysing)